MKFTNYSSADGDVIHELYLKLYEQKLDGRNNVQLLPNRVIDRVSNGRDGVVLALREVHTGSMDIMAFDAVVLATGFRNLGSGEASEGYPSLLGGIADRLQLTPESVLHIGRDYDLGGRADGERLPPLYLNGLCESSHGFGDAGSFSLLSVRSETIARSLAGRLNGDGAGSSQRRENGARRSETSSETYDLRPSTAAAAGG